ncbi:MAG: hypothetical protein Q4B82_06070 [Alysiella sp.]|uniref:hypothetical protein n=1 Tax=Alysiella sp. TaxID=1872483 RepID=UPI0026DC8B85|nr:hypothetical protein [Alysiella sp.]MDO4434128.1 hypothetical protein [Alysiella sp.]
MKIKTFLVTLLFCCGTLHATSTENIQNFIQLMKQLSPEEKAPLVRQMIKLLDEKTQTRYQKDPKIESMQVSLSDNNINTLLIHIKIKADHDLTRLSADPQAAAALKKIFEIKMQQDNPFCIRNQKDQDMFDILGISHIQFQIHTNNVVLSDKRTPLTWCR